ncbi:hypothetical protein LOD99_14203 [Oopsacas minuta]|uniref:Uncharacterized protein n=1 Tax=Oopsacas minuta TaxID=111878 RepID=A0AAV7KF29_9METZ|nr:hypothetical protein LOD99_14203 [Oopsacas minuta]
MTDRRRPGRPRTVRTFSKISRVSQRIRRNPSRSIRIMAKEIQISRESKRRIVRSDVQMKVYKLNKSQLLSEQNKNKRLQKCKELVSRFTNHTHRDILFSDEKLITVEQVLNSKNDRILATAKNTLPKSTFQVSRAKMPASVMVWGGITFDGRTPLVFIPQGLKINQTVYRDLILKKVVEPWAKKHYQNRN